MAHDDTPPGHGEHKVRPEASQDQPPDLATKINRLFQVMHPSDQRPPSNRKVAEEITQRYGIDISQNYLATLRSGQRSNPTLRHLQALAWYFGVDPNYFFSTDAAARIDAELDFLAALRDAGVRNVALRTAEASGPTREAIQQFADHAARLDRRRASGGREAPENE